MAPGDGRLPYASCSTAASRPGNGHPEEIRTRHQPISIPIGPRRGRECQWPQPGSPRSSREIRIHLNSAGATIIRSRRSRLRDSSSARSRRARRASPTRMARASRTSSNSPRPITRGSREAAGIPVSIAKRGKASAAREASCRSSRPICRRRSARARRGSAASRSAARLSRSSLGRVSRSSRSRITGSSVDHHGGLQSENPVKAFSVLA